MHWKQNECPHEVTTGSTIAYKHIGQENYY